MGSFSTLLKRAAFVHFTRAFLIVFVKDSLNRYLCFLLFLHTHTHTSSAALILVSLGVIQIRWLLEDEIVSALRHSRVIGPAMLQKVAEHVLRSSGRPHCHCEEVPLQFVFGPEQSLEKFKEARRTNRI